MKIVGIVFLITYLLFLFKGKVTYGGRITNNIFLRILASVIVGGLGAVCVGFPLWGIVALIESIF